MLDTWVRHNFGGTENPRREHIKVYALPASRTLGPSGILSPGAWTVVSAAAPERPLQLEPHVPAGRGWGRDTVPLPGLGSPAGPGRTRLHLRPPRPPHLCLCWLRGQHRGSGSHSEWCLSAPWCLCEKHALYRNTTTVMARAPRCGRHWASAAQLNGGVNRREQGRPVSPCAGSLRLQRTKR